MNFNRERQIQGFAGSNSNGVVIVHRGSISFVPLDYGFSSRTWTTAVMVHGSNSTQTQQLALDVMSLVNYWEENGGGSFSRIDSGTAGVTTVSTGTFTESGQNFNTTVQANDTLVIFDGDDFGSYNITSVDSDTQLTCSATFAGDTGQDWHITRDGLVMTSFEQGIFDTTMEKTAVGELSFFSKQTART